MARLAADHDMENGQSLIVKVVERHSTDADFAIDDARFPVRASSAGDDDDDDHRQPPPPPPSDGRRPPWTDYHRRGHGGLGRRPGIERDGVRQAGGAGVPGGIRRHPDVDDRSRRSRIRPPFDRRDGGRRRRRRRAVGGGSRRMGRGGVVTVPLHAEALPDRGYRDPSTNLTGDCIGGGGVAGSSFGGVVPAARRSGDGAGIRLRVRRTSDGDASSTCCCEEMTQIQFDKCHHLGHHEHEISIASSVMNRINIVLYFSSIFIPIYI